MKGVWLTSISIPTGHVCSDPPLRHNRIHGATKNPAAQHTVSASHLDGASRDKYIKAS